MNKDKEDFIKKVKSVFSIGEGKDVYEEMLAKYYDKKEFVKGIDSLELAYRAGQRSVVRRYKEYVEKKLN